jgi:prepilin-type N-terminal cleavage/methylation domain-containing protein
MSREPRPTPVFFSDGGEMSEVSRFVRKPRCGFTLVELAVVVVIIGVLAAFGVPRFLESVERSKASESFGYLSAVRSAQERYQAREGTYADDVEVLDIDYAPLKYFDASAITLTGENGWSMTLTRKAGASGYQVGGADYTVVFDQDGYNATESTIPAEVNPIGGQPASGG